ncbi:MAG TPA: right-handed parallel beta-helix repeat-containing protein [Candidatus Saccharimonadales bacterium]|nr:right-handed parallel beta-helix repeat-containing protein [Candidatus Saccharimonadales bacterium]
MSIAARRMQRTQPVTGGGTGPAMATFSGVSTSLIATHSVGGTVNLTGTSLCYVALFKGGVQEGDRIIVNSASSTLSILSPATSGTYTVRAYSTRSGGTLLGESAGITVAGSSTLISPAYFVSPTGSDTNPGSQAAPFLTFEKARDTIRAGGSTKTVYIRGGTYSPAAKFLLNNYDNNTKWLAYPGETPVIDGGGTLNDIWFFDAGARNITLHGVTFQNVYCCAVNLNGYNNAGSDTGTIEGVVVANCTIKTVLPNPADIYADYGAIRATSFIRNNVFRNNYIQDCGGPGIALVAGGGTEFNFGNKVIRNKIINSNNQGRADTGGIYMLDRGYTGQVANPTIIDGNYIENAGSGSDTKLLYLDDQASKVVVSNNIMCGLAHWAFQLHGSDYITMQNNIFDISDQTVPSGYYLALYQNANTYTNYGMTNNVFTGNVVYDAGGYAKTTMWDIIDESTEGITMPSVSGNIYYKTTGQLPNGGQVVDSSPYFINPNLTNPAGRDYSFTSTSGINQIGFTPITQSFIGPQ